MAALSTRSPQAEGPTAQKLVLESLDMALAQRSKFHLVFDPSVTTLVNLSATLLDFTARSMNVELTGPRAVPQSWRGAQVTCYFRITDRANRSVHVFYSFTTPIEKIVQQAEGVAVLTLRTPEALQRSQRRQSMRVKVDLRQFSVLSFWIYGQAGFDLANPFLNLEMLHKKLARVENLSAGGMRLVLAGSLLKSTGAAVEKGARFIIQMHFKGVEGGPDDPYWIIARISNASRDFVTKDAGLGMEFIAEGRLDPETGKVAWKKVADNVISGIGKWTYKWNLEVYREKGLSNA
jgi:hypothetical protein